jgi:glutathione peroxidase
MLTDRRIFLAVIAVALASPALAQAPAMSRITAFTFHFDGLDGQDIPLGKYAGRPILIVNTASQCGYTPQYTGLQALWTRYRDRGLVILGVPSNDFGGQEPGGAVEITETAVHHYGASFPITAKVMVNGEAAHPFYKWAATQRPLDRPRWNFHKYLIGRDGLIAASFSSDVTPTDPRVISAIEKELVAAGTN